jgi:uncharacterized protein YbjQ (UPF0145 family)
VVAVGNSDNGLFSGPKVDSAFEDAKQQLRDLCEALGGDAVINCDFELRDYSGGLNVVAFGTVVKYVDVEANQ